MAESLLLGLQSIMHWEVQIMALAGVVAGILISCLPGLGATMTVALLLPFTFGMSPVAALLLLAGVYIGAMFGGAIPAILLSTPGTPSAVSTTFDGYPMAKKGMAGKALAVACIALNVIAAALARGPRTVAVKLGGSGAVASDGTQTVQTPAFKVQVVDTVGAGDGFDAGFVYGHLKGWRLTESLRLGAVCGACAVTVSGDYEGYPRLQEAEQLLGMSPKAVER